MPDQEKKHRSGKPLTVVVLALLALLSITNLGIVKEPLSKFVRRNIAFREFVGEVQNGYISDRFTQKYSFVNLNGLFGRLTGRRALNEVYKLDNGMLSGRSEYADMRAWANGIAGFSNYLREQEGIPFLYIQLPYKESLEGQTFPAGVPTYANRNADDLLSQLSARGVETLDMRPLLVQTPEMMRRYLYKTDHHWTPDGAFVAFQEILNYVHTMFPDGNVDLTYAQADQWERHSIDNWFLGSSGKRVGIFFGGTDPLIWYTPRFETEMSFAVPHASLFYRGDFTKANIREKYIEEKDYYYSTAYAVYVGDDYPLVQNRNLDAPSPLKLLILKDSFTNPLQAMLSTVFQEIDVIDPRFFSDCTVAEYVDRTKPDLVLLPLMSFGPAYQDFGERTAVPMKTEEILYEPVIQQDIEVAMSGDDQNCAAIPVESNTVYRVSFERMDVLEGQAEGAGLRLFNKTTGEMLEAMMFDLAYCEATNGFSWIIRTPDTRDEFDLRFYAGVYGSAAGNNVVYRNVVVEELRASAP